VAVAINPASADQGSSSPPAAAQPAVASAPAPQAAASAPGQNRAGQARGTTVVAFEPGALAALAPLNPRALRPGSLALAADEANVFGSFPIVGDPTQGRISHTGGLSLTDGTTTVALRNFIIDTTVAQPVLTADVEVSGQNIGRIPFLDVAPQAAQPGCDVSASLTLSSAAGFALADVFGVPDLSSATIGSGCVDIR
jgi:hypothetical protein